MSDSDDTDVLLLIPPDLFFIPSSDSEDNLDSCDWQQSKSGVVSELIDHMQTLESRILAIESKESPNNSLNLSRRMSLDSVMSCRPAVPKTKYSVSRNSSLQSSPNKPSQCFSLPSTPNVHQHSNCTHERHHHQNSIGNHQSYKKNSSFLKKHHHFKPFSESVHSPQCGSEIKSALHVGIQSPGKGSRALISPALDLCENTRNDPNEALMAGHNSSDYKSTKDMNLPEVNKLSKKVQIHDKDKAFINHQKSNGHPLQVDTGTSIKHSIFEMKNGDECTNNRVAQVQKLVSNGHSTLLESTNSTNCGKRRELFDSSLYESSFSSFDTERFMTEFRTWNPNGLQDVDCTQINKINPKDFEDSKMMIDEKQKKVGQHVDHSIEKNDLSSMINCYHEENSKKNNDQHTNAFFVPKYSYELPVSQTHSKNAPSDFPTSESIAEMTEVTSSMTGDSNCLRKNSTSNTNEEGSVNKRPQRLLTLSDIWNQDSNKAEEERLQLKLEEEKFRREHCEQIIQDLQKRLLESEEKIAVAIRVDNEKNSFISQFQVSWQKMNKKLHELETERESLKEVLKESTEKYQLEIVEYQKQIVKYNEELSKTLNLATGFKEKSDAFNQEKVELLKNHADELQSYKTLVQQSENRYEEMKIDCQKLLEKNKKLDETMKSVQQDLNTELMKSSKVKVELSVIHKSLDACEAELVILRQEKENLQLKLKEEYNRNTILEQARNALIKAVDEAKESEKLATNEVRSLTEQQEKLRAELRDVYQKQVDEVVKTKLHEFQTQLDSAEAVFQNEVETKQRAIAECAARKIKSVMDKHQLEIHLIEEKHKEEKKLFELQLAQAVQKSTILETQLNSYRKSKSQLVEQLYSMLQKQWQQALVIISGGNGENMSSFQKISVDKLFDFSNDENLELIPEHCSTLCANTARSGMQRNSNVKYLQSKDVQNESLVTLAPNEEPALSSRKESKSDLKKYIKMILDMQQRDNNQTSKMVNDNVASSQKEEPCREPFGKSGAANEAGSKWQQISEASLHDTSEYLSPPQKFAFKSGDQTKEKLPWR